MNDQNIFLLTPHILSTTSNKISKDCLENDETIENQFSRFFFSGSKIPQDLLNSTIEKCIQKPEFLESLKNNVLDCELLKKHNIRRQHQINVLKTIISKLEGFGISVPDKIYDRIGLLISEKDEDEVERVYLNKNNTKIFASFIESSTQLSKGTTGLAVWQASCDLANLCQFLPFSNSKILELGAGCGVSGISIAAKFPNSLVYLSDYDENVLKLLEKNVKHNNLKNCRVSSLDWFNFDKNAQKSNLLPEFLIAADVVYDIELLPSLCDVISYYLTNSTTAAIIACTLRNPESLKRFETEIEKAGIKVIEKIKYENEKFEIDENCIEFPTIFPFSSSLKTPTIFYNLQV